MRSQIIRGFAYLDLCITLPFALPFVAEGLVIFIYRVDFALGFGSTAPVLDPLSLMFIHIMGVLGVVWALTRIREPSEILARRDGLGRLVVAAWIVHAITWSASPVLWLFVFTELAGSVMQLRRPPAD
ncbi:hypothetical protein [Parvibaculum sp.]|uniref:hypothetical protein n=1 Tax=Parvibaculum sp. TaxID=2024848 RepID=UPI002CF4F3CE|nr:hypothetical protein [Parvibaculum sp.]HUD51025.1 hypothetical protein [Parvibaculum sp.]